LKNLARSLLALAAAATSACGPVGATSLVSDAEVAVSRAHAADGDTYAIYATTAADLYLQKAREEQGRAHYSAAMDLARRSVELADEAAKKAADAKKQVPAGPPAPPASVARPPAQSEIAPPPPAAIAPKPAEPPAPVVAPPPSEAAPGKPKEPIQPEDKK
jgi:hypothetical protein